jgi:hypothetical protein
MATGHHMRCILSVAALAGRADLFVGQFLRGVAESIFWSV